MWTWLPSVSRWDAIAVTAAVQDSKLWCRTWYPHPAASSPSVLPAQPRPCFCTGSTDLHRAALEVAAGDAVGKLPFCVQEIVPLNASNVVMGASAEAAAAWDALIDDALNRESG